MTGKAIGVKAPSASPRTGGTRNALLFSETAAVLSKSQPRALSSKLTTNLRVTALTLVCADDSIKLAQSRLARSNTKARTDAGSSPSSSLGGNSASSLPRMRSSRTCGTKSSPSLCTDSGSIVSRICAIIATPHWDIHVTTPFIRRTALVPPVQTIACKRSS